ncbi:uncharacterized protein LOC128627364 isoform X1 [Artibeus jamaicensis]|uniref:uncharacterized protein LOC128627364 isoform X1 n=1 Tax=Artibeus jamaicensis TaxID=9417 RepID=UPI00235B1E99|nr:uncharacterized protein LOC128627364 isoform X1 [Artibeus jamaicensis]
MVFPCEIPNQGSQFASLCLPGSQKSVPSVLVPTPCLPTSAETRCGQPRDLLCPVDFSRQALCIQLPAQHPSPGCTTKEVNLRDHRREPPLHPQRTHKALGVALGDLYNPMSLPSTPDDFGDLQIIRSIHLSTSTVKRVQGIHYRTSEPHANQGEQRGICSTRTLLFRSSEADGKQGDRPLREPAAVPDSSGLCSPAAPQPKRYKGK